MDDRVSSEADYSFKSNKQAKNKINSHSSGLKALNSEHQTFLNEVLDGLSQPQKTLPCKYFYDEKGSQLFEEICELEEYYVTRVELALLEDIKFELAELIGKNATIIEPGAGAGIKIRTLLNALESPNTYVPLDISEDFLFYSAQIIQKEFPQVNIAPILGDFTLPVNWLDKQNNGNRVVFFPGSTIGNFEQIKAIEFLTNMHQLIGTKGALIIGVDLIKEKEVLESAYNDGKGITEAFNKNLLNRINQQLNANFNLNCFHHNAYFNQQLQRIEMHLVSQEQQQVKVNGTSFSFLAGESIHTENSHKYSVEGFLQMASKAKLKCVKTWVDDQRMIGVHYLVQE